MDENKQQYVKRAMRLLHGRNMKDDLEGIFFFDEAKMKKYQAECEELMTRPKIEAFLSEMPQEDIAEVIEYYDNLIV